MTVNPDSVPWRRMMDTANSEQYLF